MCIMSKIVLCTQILSNSILQNRKKELTRKIVTALIRDGRIFMSGIHSHSG